VSVKSLAAALAKTSAKPDAVVPPVAPSPTEAAVSAAVSQDPVNANYNAEKVRFLRLLAQDRVTVSQETSKLDTLQRSLTALTQQRQSTQEGVDTATALLKHAKEKLAYDQKQHDLYVSQESHHKKVAQVRQRIEAYQEKVTLHAEELKQGKERLQKALREETDLEGARGRHLPQKEHGGQHANREQTPSEAAYSSSASQGDEAPTAVKSSWPRQVPAKVEDSHIEAAVEAVQTSINPRAIEAELKPKIEALKERYKGQDPASLQEAIQALVSHTVGKSVDEVIAKNQHASAAVHRATQIATEAGAAADDAAAKALRKQAISAGVQAAKQSGLGLAKAAAKHAMMKSAASMGTEAEQGKLPPKAGETELAKKPKPKHKSKASSWLGTIEEALDPFS